MTKPFHKEELVARIHAVVRRSKGHAQSVIRTGDITVNLDAKTVEVNGIRVHLTGKEYQMLELLSLRKGTTLTKEMFLNHLYGGMDEPELKIIDVFICKLRKKLAAAANGKHHIETVWGRGYVLRDPSCRWRVDHGFRRAAEGRLWEWKTLVGPLTARLVARAVRLRHRATAGTNPTNPFVRPTGADEPSLFPPR
jgi:DNA-binding winged helix-turn-helix (wHTH) protein